MGSFWWIYSATYRLRLSPTFIIFSPWPAVCITLEISEVSLQNFISGSLATCTRRIAWYLALLSPHSTLPSLLPSFCELHCARKLIAMQCSEGGDEVQSPAKWRVLGCVIAHPSFLWPRGRVHATYSICHLVGDCMLPANGIVVRSLPAPGLVFITLADPWTSYI